MSRTFLVKDIALQSGTSVATVDRVLNGRAGVRQHTIRRVEQAIEALESQKQQIGLSGRKFIVDVVVSAPNRFSQLVQTALEEVMPSLQPSIFRARYALKEEFPITELIATLNRIATLGSQGVILKAPDVPEIVEAVNRLKVKGIPVVTLVTDLPNSARCAYVGMDNRAAGRTAAYLMHQALGPRQSGILLSISSNRFRGEEEREMGFRQWLRDHHAKRTIHEVSEGMGLHATTHLLTRKLLEECPEINAVYSVGGGNRAILSAFDQLKRRCKIFIAHDLDADNDALLRQGALHIVLLHDLKQDLRNACLRIMSAQGFGDLHASFYGSNVQVITPHNIPLGKPPV